MSAQVHQMKPSDKAKKEGMYLRRIIRRDKCSVMTNAQAKVLTEMVNLWLHHRNGPKGYIHPSREAIAKKQRISVVTVARALEVLRRLEVIRTIGSTKGGNGKATRYKVDCLKVQALFDPHNVVTIEGELVPFTVSNSKENEPCNDTVNDTVVPYQNDTLSICKVKTSNQEVGNDFEGGDQ